MSYFATANEMSEALGLPLLAHGEFEGRFLTRHRRLSGYAVEPFQSGGFYHRWLDRVREVLGRAPGDGTAVWVAGPAGTLENLPWAIGLAEQVARKGGRPYLAGAQVAALRPQGGARGESLPRSLLERPGAWLPENALAVTSDIEGVRLIVSGGDDPPTVFPADNGAGATLVLSDPLPEAFDGPYLDPRTIDGAVLVVAFRDHDVREITAYAQGMAAAGIRVLGLVAMGPTSKSPGGGADSRADAPSEAARKTSDRTPILGLPAVGAGSEGLPPVDAPNSVDVYPRLYEREPVQEADGRGARASDEAPTDSGLITRTSWGDLAGPGKRTWSSRPRPGRRTSDTADGMAPAEVAGSAEATEPGVSEAEEPVTLGRFPEPEAPAGAGPDDSEETRRRLVEAADAAKQELETRLQTRGKGATPEAAAPKATPQREPKSPRRKPVPSRSPAARPPDDPEITVIGRVPGSTSPSKVESDPGPLHSTAQATPVPEDPTVEATVESARDGFSPSGDGPPDIAPARSVSLGGAVEGSASAAPTPSVALLSRWQKESRRRGRAGRVLSQIALVVIIAGSIAGVYWGSQQMLQARRSAATGAAALQAEASQASAAAQSRGSQPRAADLPADSRGSASPNPSVIDPSVVDRAQAPRTGAVTTSLDTAAPLQAEAPEAGRSAAVPPPPGASTGETPAGEGLDSPARSAGERAASTSEPPLDTADRVPGDPAAPSTAAGPGDVAETRPAESPAAAGSAAIDAGPAAQRPDDSATTGGTLPDTPGSDTAVEATQTPPADAGSPAAGSNVRPVVAPPPIMDDAPSGAAVLPVAEPAPAVRDTFVVHFASFRLRDDAAKEVERLVASGIDARYVYVHIPGKGPWYRVVTGVYSSFEDARAAGLAIGSAHGISLMHVIRKGGRASPVPIVN